MYTLYSFKNRPIVYKGALLQSTIFLLIKIK
jgi:hypothetical protein